MNRQEAEAIISEERLWHTNLWQRPDPIQDEVGIIDTPTGYLVYVSDERASIRTADEFDDESAALELFIRKARLIQKVLHRDRARDGS